MQNPKNTEPDYLENLRAFVPDAHMPAGGAQPDCADHLARSLDLIAMHLRDARSGGADACTALDRIEGVIRNLHMEPAPEGPDVCDTCECGECGAGIYESESKCTLCGSQVVTLEDAQAASDVLARAVSAQEGGAS